MDATAINAIIARRIIADAAIREAEIRQRCDEEGWDGRATWSYPCLKCNGTGLVPARQFPHNT